MTDQLPATSGAMQSAISNAVVRLYRDYTGRGPTKARTIVQDDTVVVMLADLLTKAERKLVEDDQADLVLSMRHTFQMTMRDELSTAIEDLTHRRVVGFMSGNQIDPDMACEVFVLAAPDATRP
jgi:uncharacterized protein YbcI